MSKRSNLLTAREIHGPYIQLLTNLQGERGDEWLVALKKLNKRLDPWGPRCLNPKGVFELSARTMTESYNPVQVLEFFGSRWNFKIERNFQDLVLERMIHNAVVLGLWRNSVPARFLGVDAVGRKASEEEVLTELPDGFSFRVDEAWFRLMQIFSSRQNYLGLGDHRLFVNSAASEEDKPLLTRICVSLAKDGTVTLDAYESSVYLTYEPGIQIVTNKIW